MQFKNLAEFILELHPSLRGEPAEINGGGPLLKAAY